MGSMSAGAIPTAEPRHGREERVGFISSGVVDAGEGIGGSMVRWSNLMRRCTRGDEMAVRSAHGGGAAGAALRASAGPGGAQIKKIAVSPLRRRRFPPSF